MSCAIVADTPPKTTSSLSIELKVSVPRSVAVTLSSSKPAPPAIVPAWPLLSRKI